MKALVNILLTLLLFALLTLLTQVGGLIYLLWKPVGFWIKRKYKSGWKVRLGKPISFLVFYSLIVFLILPPIAKKYGRVPLPLFSSEEVPIKPRMRWFTCLANRHYVTPKMRKTMIEISQTYHKTYPDMELRYLDANFPFWDGFPLWPHLSHSDGKKVDISFVYKNSKTQALTSVIPSFLGYGAVEAPRKGEVDKPRQCENAGHKQYNIISKIVAQRWRNTYIFAPEPNKTLIRNAARHPNIGKIFIEPHLKQRLGFGQYNKIRFTGCRAVRHDDHIHLQL